MISAHTDGLLSEPETSGIYEVAFPPGRRLCLSQGSEPKHLQLQRHAGSLDPILDLKKATKEPCDKQRNTD